MIPTTLAPSIPCPHCSHLEPSGTFKTHVMEKLPLKPYRVASAHGDYRNYGDCNSLEDARAAACRIGAVILTREQPKDTIPKPPSLEILTEIAKRWNERHPIGTPVTRYRLIDPLEDPMETRTRSMAWVVGGHSVLVSVEGVSGGVLLDSVTVKQATDGVLTQ